MNKKEKSNVVDPLQTICGPVMVFSLLKELDSFYTLQNLMWKLND
jgi:hypothetical protein